jgi:glycosyltransferase involved in cell wall biosynthesis
MNFFSEATVDLSFVVIGLNEGERLRLALQAIFDTVPSYVAYEVIYADSGSTDSSCAIAADFHSVKVLRLETSSPSAAKARNLGLRAARGNYVQLLDGDSIIQPGWLDAALSLISQNKFISCVFGRCIEEFPEQSIYMKVCGVDWHVRPGIAKYCGGNALWKLDILRDVGFFSERIKFGEEPDLCYKVRHKGFEIRCIDQNMVKHDLAMKKFSQYWRRAENSGRAYFGNARRYFRNSEKLWLYENFRNLGEVASWFLIFFLVLFLAEDIGVAALSLLAFWFFRAVQISLKVKSRTGLGTAFLYGIHAQFIRLPTLVGQIKELMQCR